MDLWVWHSVEDVVPSRGPFNVVVLDVLDRIGVSDVDLVGEVRVAWDLERLHVGLERARFRAAVHVGVALDLDLRVHDAAAVLEERRAPFFGRAVVVADLEVNVVE